MAIFTAIAAAVTSFLATSVAFFGCTVLGSAIATATGWIVAGGIASAVAKATGIFKPAGVQQSKDPGVKIQISPATDNRVPVFYGTINTGAIICDAGIKNQNNTMVYVMVISEKTDTGTYSVGPIRRGDATLNFGFNSANVVSMTDPNATSTTNVANKMRCRVYAGGTAAGDQIFPVGTQVAATTLLPTISATTNYDDLVYAVFEMDYDAENSLTSLGAITFEITNSLKEPSNVLLDYCTNSRYGAGLTSAELNLPSFDALYDYSTEQVNYLNSANVSTPHNRWQIDGMVSTYQDVKSNIDRLCTSCSAFFAYNPQLGQFSVVPNRAATTAEKNAAFLFNDDVVMGQIDISSTELYSLYNSIEAEYPSVATKDQTDVVIVTTPAGDKNPNEPDNPLQTRYDLVNDAPRVHNLANIDLRQSRISTVVSFEATYEAMGVDVGDVVKLTNAIYGWTNKLFRVMRTTEIELPSGMLITKFILMEYSDTVYAHNEIQSDGATGLSGIPGWIPGIWGNIDYGNIANIIGNITIVDDPLGANANVIAPGTGTVITTTPTANVVYGPGNPFNIPGINFDYTVPNIIGGESIMGSFIPMGPFDIGAGYVPTTFTVKPPGSNTTFTPGEVIKVSAPSPTLGPADRFLPGGPLSADMLARIELYMENGLGNKTATAQTANITLKPKGSIGRGDIGHVQAGLQYEEDVANMAIANSSLSNIQLGTPASIVTPVETIDMGGIDEGLYSAVNTAQPYGGIPYGGGAIAFRPLRQINYKEFNIDSAGKYTPSANADIIDIVGGSGGYATGLTTVPTMTDNFKYEVSQGRGSNLAAALAIPRPPASATKAYLANTMNIINYANSDFLGQSYGSAVTAGSFVVGVEYEIVSVGTTNFTLIGAASNTVGVSFTATGVGSGTGTASPATGRGFDVTNLDKRISKSDFYIDLGGFF